jgi:AcrR family transcriptional regulator
VTIHKRDEALLASLDLLREGCALSLDAVAKRVGLTKPGLMHHFPTKEALMLALTDHVVEGYDRSLSARVTGPVEALSPAERIRAYLDWSLEEDFDAADLVMMADPRLRAMVTERWVERLARWLDLDPGLPDADRTRLTALRLMADGAWFATASGTLSLSPQQRYDLRALADTLLEEPT